MTKGIAILVYDMLGVVQWLVYAIKLLKILKIQYVHFIFLYAFVDQILWKFVKITKKFKLYTIFKIKNVTIHF